MNGEKTINDMKKMILLLSAVVLLAACHNPSPGSMW